MKEETRAAIFAMGHSLSKEDLARDCRNSARIVEGLLEAEKRIAELEAEIAKPILCTVNRMAEAMADRKAADATGKETCIILKPETQCAGYSNAERAELWLAHGDDCLTLSMDKATAREIVGALDGLLDDEPSSDFLSQALNEGDGVYRP